MKTGKKFSVFLWFQRLKKYHTLPHIQAVLPINIAHR